LKTCDYKPSRSLARGTASARALSLFLSAAAAAFLLRMRREMCPPDVSLRHSLQEHLPSWRKRLACELSNPASIEQAFRILDRDGDGEVGSTDLWDFFTDCMHQNMSQEEAKAMVIVADMCSKGSVTLADFRCLVGSSEFGDAVKLAGTASESDVTMDFLWAAFHFLDVDKDGFLSLEDLRNALSSNLAFSDECIDDMLSNAAQGDGGAAKASVAIDFNTFARLIITNT
ncbi:hypothetical protein GOP47_0015043, partial [Adiantum capillus-veneris]